MSHFKLCQLDANTNMDSDSCLEMIKIQRTELIYNKPWDFELNETMVNAQIAKRFSQMTDKEEISKILADWRQPFVRPSVCFPYLLDSVYGGYIIESEDPYDIAEREKIQRRVIAENYNRYKK